jgi:hypothetical protein
MVKDLLLDEDDDLLIEGGDLVVDESAEQEVGLLLRTNQGDWRNNPLTGFGLDRRTRNEVNRTEFARDLQGQLELDGFGTAQVELSADGQLTINARRNG